MTGVPRVQVTEDGLYSVLEPIVELVLQKNTEYCDSWQVFGPLEALLRVHVKGARYLSMSRNSHIVMFSDATIDTLTDIIGHATLALLYISEVYENDGQEETESQAKERSSGRSQRPR